MRTILRSKRGQSLVEVALLTPLLLMLSVLVIDIGRSFYYREAVTNAARQALRAAVQPSAKTTGNTYCAGNAGVASSNLPNPNPDAVSDIFPTIVNSAALESSSDGLKTGSALNNTTNQTTIKVTWHCLSSAAITNATQTSTDPANSGSDSVTVHIDYSFQLFTPYAANLINSGSQVVHIKIDEPGRAEY